MRIKIFFFAFFILTGSVYAFQDQSVSVFGKVTDEKGFPLSGAAVTVDDSFLGTVCDAEGNYFLGGLKRERYMIRFSFVGYEPQTLAIFPQADTGLNVMLLPATLVTGEVIVNAVRAGERTPMAYSTVGNETIRKSNTGQYIPFLLQLTPSLVETSEAGNGIGYTNMRIRGTDASRINVTIDGIPLNDPESQQVFWVDLPDLASSVDNIQVQRGVGSSSNGAGAFGATVSIQSKSPSGEPFAELESAAGSYNTFRNSAAAGTGLIADKFALQMRMSKIKSDGYIKRTGSDHTSSNISGVFIAGKSRFRANILLGEEHTGLGWWGVPREMLAVDRRYNPAGEYTDDEGFTRYYDNETDNYRQDHYQLIFGHSFSDALNISTALHYTRGKGYYEEYNEDEDLSEYISVPSLNTDLITRKWMSNDFYGIVASLKYKTGRLEILSGANSNYYSGDHFGTIIWSKYSNVEKDQQWYFNNGTKYEAGIFTRATVALNSKISVYGDLQYRYIDYRMTGEDDDHKDLEQDHRYGFFNPRAGLFWSISSTQEGWLSFSVAGREPTRADFKEAAGDPEATPQDEKLYDAEAGYRIRSRIFTVGLNAYLMYYRDQLIPTGELSSTGYSIMTNVEKSYRSGVEISAGIKPFRFMEWNMNLTLSRNKIAGFTEYYTYYDTITWEQEYKSKALGLVDIAYSPSVICSGDLALHIRKNLEMHLTGKYVGKQYFDNTMSSDRMIDPYFVNNLMISWEPEVKKTKGIRLRLFVNNIFDAQYESNAYGGNWYEGGVEKTWSYYFPQAGINYMLSAGITF
ncbi:MAG: TonB-dependent receptor [Bacteroidales bacterium]|nr:TonB-dependent receptor [Bacteroidales bacterium]